MIKVLGLDPSYTHFGIAQAVLNAHGTYHVEMATTVVTEPTTHKTVRKSSDDLERSIEIYRELKKAVDWADVVFAEVQHGSQSANAMKSYGICIGLLSTITKPFFPLSEGEIKKTCIGKRTATKAEMIEWAVNNHPEAPYEKTRAIGRAVRRCRVKRRAATTLHSNSGPGKPARPAGDFCRGLTRGSGANDPQNSNPSANFTMSMISPI